MQKVNIFLSSAMTGELDEERAVIRVLFKNSESLTKLFDLYAFEDHASPRHPQKAYLDEVRRSDIFLLLLKNALRIAVNDEFDEATRSKKKVFCYISSSSNKSSELESFIKEKAHKYDCCSFSDSSDLARKIKEDIQNDLIRNYRKRAELDVSDDRDQLVYFESNYLKGEEQFFSSYDVLQSSSRIMELGYNDEQLIALASILKETEGHFFEALMILHVVLHRNPKQWMALNNIAIIYDQMGLLELAERNYKLAIKHNINCHSAYYNLAKIAYRNGSYPEAICSYEQALKIMPEKLNCLNGLTACYLALEDYGNALIYADKAQKMNPKDQTTNFNYLSSLIANGKFDSALPQIDKLIEDKTVRTRLRAELYYRQGSYEKSLMQLSELERLGTLDLDQALRKFYCFLRMNEIEKAISWIKSYDEICPIKSGTWNNLGFVLMDELKLNACSIEFFKKAIQLKPSLFVAWANLQVAYGNQNEIDKCLAACERALELNNLDPKSNLNKLISLFQLGKEDEAKDFILVKIANLFNKEMTQKKLLTIRKNLDSRNPLKRLNFWQIIKSIVSDN